LIKYWLSPFGQRLDALFLTAAELQETSEVTTAANTAD
jgi:hypothetical protein